MAVHRRHTRRIFDGFVELVANSSKIWRAAPSDDENYVYAIALP